MSGPKVRSYFETVRPRLRGLHPAIACRLDGAVLDGLLRLDALPGDDPFWTKSEGRATNIAALESYCDRVLAEDRDDVRALWTKLGLAIWRCDRDFGMNECRELWRIGQGLDLEWLVEAAHFVWAATAAPTQSALARFIAAERLADEAIPALRELRDAGRLCARWTTAVLRALNQSSRRSSTTRVAARRPLRAAGAQRR